MGAGVASGKVVIATIGPPERAELGVIGDPINVAARLVASAGPGEIWLQGAVYRAIEQGVRAELLGPLAVRGRMGAVEVYRIAPLLGTSDPPGT
jgi:class 3 adenylate cyclase